MVGVSPETHSTLNAGLSLENDIKMEYLFNVISMTHYHSFTAILIFFPTENNIITTTYFKMTTIDKDRNFPAKFTS